VDRSITQRAPERSLTLCGCRRSDADLFADFHDPVCGKLEVGRRVDAKPRERDVEVVLPPGEPRVRVADQSAPSCGA
jgi:hypothetical protein